MPDTNQPSSLAVSDAVVLPHWDLSDLYPAMDSPALEADLERLKRLASTFEAHYSGTLAALDGNGLAEAIAGYEAIGEGLGRVGSYAQLLRAVDMADVGIAKFAQAMEERLTDISSVLIFFDLELNRIEDADLKAKLAASATLRRYAPWLDTVRALRPHQLSDVEERLLLEKSVTGRSAWVRLYDETLADLRFSIGGKDDLNLSAALALFNNPDRSLRQAAAAEVSRVMKANSRVFTLVTNTLAKDKEIEDRWRHFAHPWSGRNLGNQVEDEVVDALVSAVKSAYPSLSHRYYQWKAKQLGLSRMDHFDRNAPLPAAETAHYTWEQARDIVLAAYGQFSPQMRAVGQQFFDHHWIDAALSPAKESGAFAHPTVPSVHPYLLTNFHGRVDDVMTLAHELGHGVHQVLAGPQGPLLSDTPLTLAETASVFGEMLTFRSLLKAETDPLARKAMLAGKVDSMLNTVVRQIAFYDFEKRVHTERREHGELSPERLGEIWLAVQTESLGPVFAFGKDYTPFWSYISHFIHAPFYVYAYAFGDCLVDSLYAAYQEASKAGRGEHFAALYIDMLKAGGSKRHRELLAPFGLDASDPGFWTKGLAMLSGFIDELEAGV